MLYFIIGGAASGKSEFAERMVCALPGKRLYIATMTAADEESLERIRKHRERRSGLGFETLECGENLAAAEIPEGTNALLEDLSNLLANEMFSPSGGGAEAAETGLRHLIDRCENLTVVSNDLFSDGMTYTGETLDYLKNLAALNRELAGEADFAAEIVCGLPDIWKGKLPW